jgi:hypothetical protein
LLYQLLARSVLRRSAEAHQILQDADRGRLGQILVPDGLLERALATIGMVERGL